MDKGLSNIKLGDFVIRGDADAPCELTASLVVGILDRPDGEKMARVLYVSRRLRHCTQKNLLTPNIWNVRRLTRVQDFGISVRAEVVGDDLRIHFDTVAESQAKYPDGSMRYWQPSGYACIVDPDVLHRLLPFMKVEWCPEVRD